MPVLYPSVRTLSSCGCVGDRVREATKMACADVDGTDAGRALEDDGGRGGAGRRLHTGSVHTGDAGSEPHDDAALHRPALSVWGAYYLCLHHLCASGSRRHIRSGAPSIEGLSIFRRTYTSLRVHTNARKSSGVCIDCAGTGRLLVPSAHLPLTCSH